MANIGIKMTKVCLSEIISTSPKYLGWWQEKWLNIKSLRSNITEIIFGGYLTQFHIIVTIFFRKMQVISEGHII